MPFSMGPDHANLDKNMIAALLLGMVRQNPIIKTSLIRQMVKDRYGYDIDYIKVWHSLKRAVEKVYGTWESSVAKMPAYMGAIKKWNPGTIVEWYHTRDQVASNPNHFTLGWGF